MGKADPRPGKIQDEYILFENKEGFKNERDFSHQEKDKEDMMSYIYIHTHTHTHTMEYYTATEVNGILPFVETFRHGRHYAN